MTEETIIFQNGDIKITNLRAVFGEKTYSVSNITSVEAAKINPSSCLPMSVFLLGIFLILIGIVDIKQNFSYILFGALAFVIFYFLNKVSSPSWAVSITTAAGEIKAYKSTDQESIKKIVDALNNAIIQKG